MLEGLTNIGNALYESLFDLINISIMIFLVWYNNKMGYCENYLNFLINKKECLAEGRNWIIYNHNFDNIINAIPTLFTIATGDGWGEIMKVSYNSNTED